MTILVTGATGTVGRQIVAQLVERGARVRSLTRNPAAAGLPPGSRWPAATWPRPGRRPRRWRA
ncbi:NmrA family NAD(P)-binding protein [Nonomuraea sp. KM90]|uniref:NmrA family NAD(P)-binding protein n=1 Tax=Nonomuraea sp. KM90 TaxID=3457428 RepID=UPI003FCDD293